MNWRRYDWRDDLILPLCLALLRTCWLVPWLQLLWLWLEPDWAGSGLPLPWMVALVLGGMAAGRRLATWENLGVARLAAVGVGLAAILLVLWSQCYRLVYPLWDARWLAALASDLTHWGGALPAPLVTLLVATYLWRQGVLDGHTVLHSDRVWQAFAAGLISLALALVVTGQAGQTSPGAVILVLLFFAAAMLALTITGLQLAHGAILERSEVRLTFNRHWLAIVTPVVGAVLGLGLAVTGLVAPSTLGRMLGWATIVLAYVGRAVLALLLILAYIVVLILAPLLERLAGLLRFPFSSTQMQSPDVQGQLDELAKGSQSLDPRAAEALRWVGLAGLLIAIGLAIALALLQARRQQGEEMEETRETLFSRELLGAQLSALWREWLRRLRRSHATAKGRFLPLFGEVAGRRAIRELYQALLALAAQQGRPRRRDQTPSDLERTLAGAAPPQARPPLHIITEGYLQARYAPEVPDAADVERARHAWHEFQEGSLPHAGPADGVGDASAGLGAATT